MPVRPEDFDADPPRRAAPIKPIATRPRLRDKQARAKQERELFSSVGQDGETPSPRAIPLAIAAVAVALILFAFWKPLSDGVIDLLGKPAHPVVAPDTTNQMRVPPNSPAQQTVQPSDHAAEEPMTSSPTALKPQGVSHSPPRPIQKTPPDNSEAQALKQDLERRQAELEVEKKRLTNEQTALETQRRQEAQEAARAGEQAKQEELNRQQRLRDLEESLRKQREKDATLAAHQTPPYQGPSSGTLVWEGDVDGADLIDIQNGSPNHGTVTGTLPGVPCMVQASDPKRVTISTAPAPSNEWKRIVLRVQAKGHTTVTVHWALP
jgi:hypothetical protein